MSKSAVWMKSALGPSGLLNSLQIGTGRGLGRRGGACPWPKGANPAKGGGGGYGVKRSVSGCCSFIQSIIVISF